MQSDHKAKIESTYKSTKSLEADFKQTKVSTLLKNPVIKTGKFYFQDVQIKWMITAPKKTTILITKELNKQKIENEAPKSLQGFTFIKKFMQGLMKGDFLNSKKFKTTVSENGNKLVLVAIPLDTRIKKYIEKFELIFRKSDIILEKLTIFDAAGDFTKYEFSNQKRNHQIADRVFETYH
jgi:outer membrane lipoprotein-sorting protein